MTHARHEWLMGLLFIALLNCTIVFTIICLFFWVHRARAEDHTHDGGVGNFYQSWQIPGVLGVYGGNRGGSCCNKMDCRPIVGMRHSGGGTQIQMQEPDGKLSGWYTVPDKKWEDQQADPRESPDGRSHACVRNGAVICAVRGGDI